VSSQKIDKKFKQLLNYYITIKRKTTMKKNLFKVSLLMSSMIYLTTLNAQTWAPIFTPGTATGTAQISTASLDDMSFLDDNNGIVSLGYVYHLTTDGGATWSPEKDFNPYPQFRGVHYSGTQTIFIGGGPTIFKSVNSGVTFTAQATPSPALTIRDIKVVGTFGVLVDEYCKAAYSTDGGSTWTGVSNAFLCGNLSQMNHVDVINSTRAVIAGNNGNMYETGNAGTSWSLLPAPVSSQNIAGIDFISPQIGFCAQGDIYKTTNGATTWTNITSGFSSIAGFSAADLGGGICAIDANTIYVGGKGKIFKSTDGGTTFTVDYTNTACSSCIFENLERKGNTLFASVSNGGAHPKVYKKGVNAVSVLEHQKGLEFAIMPNPASQSIALKGVDFSDDVRVSITSIDGKIIYDAMTKESVLDISSMNSGMYFIKITDSKGNSGINKFIKE
jgi:photosystem II stability/assembly factor-like uncharacterized protein